MLFLVITIMVLERTPNERLHGVWFGYFSA